MAPLRSFTYQRFGPGLVIIIIIIVTIIIIIMTLCHRAPGLQLWVHCQTNVQVSHVKNNN